MKHSDGYNRKCTTPGTLSENWGTSSQGKVGKVESRQKWKQARVKVSKKNLSQKLCLPPWLCWLIFSGFFSRPISPFLRLPNKMWSWEPKQPSRHYWFPITRFGSQQNVNLWSQKRFSLSDSKTLASSLYLSSSWFFGSFIYLVSFVDYCMNVNNKDIPYLLCGKCCHGPMNKEILGF